ncbi:MAG TPA: hypothetical protein VLW52_13350 [Opitutaceae bacterium]|nr:hypothetical protein [Opitutaceae bacterium]
MKHRMNPDELERFIHQTLRALPDRKAPGTLEARVLAEVERRAAIPWWHKSWNYWPQPVRAAFLVLCGALVVLAGLYVQAGFDTTRFHTAVAPALTLAGQVWSVVSSVGDFVAMVGRHISPLWFYGAIACVASLYAMLFGLGAAAYRIFWVRR